LFVLLLVLVLSLAVLVLVLEAIQYSNPAHWSASSREPLRSTIGIAAVRTAIEYEYRFTEYRFAEYRFAEYEYDEIRCEARTAGFSGRARLSNHCQNAFSPAPLQPLVRLFYVFDGVREIVYKSLFLDNQRLFELNLRKPSAVAMLI
jgi:hypothetical protein